MFFSNHLFLIIYVLIAINKEEMQTNPAGMNFPEFKNLNLFF